MDGQKDGTETALIFNLPPEVLLHALAFAPPTASAAFAQTSKPGKLITDSPQLWRQLHHSRFDPAPPPIPDSTLSPPYDHRLAIQQRTQTETLLRALTDEGKSVPKDLLDLVLSTLVDLARSRSPFNSEAHDSTPSRNQIYLTTYLPSTSSNLLALHPSFSASLSSTHRTSSRSTRSYHAPFPSPAQSHFSQLASQLHCLATPSPLTLSSPSLRTFAREIVYTKSNFPRSAHYGPFCSDYSGRVDWRKVEALMIVMRANLEDAAEMGGWGEELDDEDRPTTVPGGWESTRKASAGRVAGAGGRNERDWAGVEGEWRGTYSFLHFPTFHHFNHHRTSSHTPSLAGEHEAVGDCMSLELKLLPEGEWPEEIDVPDFSEDALEAADDDDEEDDVEFVAPSEGSASDDDDGSSDSEGDAYFMTTTPWTRSTRNDDSAGAVSTSALSSDNDPAASPTSSSPSPNTSPATLFTALNSENHVDSNLKSTPATTTYPPGVLSPPPPPPSGLVAPPFYTTFRPPSSSSSSASTSSSPSAAPPPLSFSGTSLPLSFRGSFSNALSSQAPGAGAGPNSGWSTDRTIRGVVRPSACGTALHWTHVIRYGGIDQWVMSSVQVERGSRVGLVGVWTSASREVEGPCGPFWYWPQCTDEAVVE